MFRLSMIRTCLFGAVFASSTAMAGQYVVELNAPFETPAPALMQQHA